MKEITPFLWFNNNVEEAMKLYVSLIPNSRILDVSRYG
jgi:predicted 3-demethylubiquinone-9 3-methyltransferase (glyoxalase superfamily)